MTSPNPAGAPDDAMGGEPLLFESLFQDVVDPHIPLVDHLEVYVKNVVIGLNDEWQAWISKMVSRHYPVFGSAWQQTLELALGEPPFATAELLACYDAYRLAARQRLISAPSGPFCLAIAKQWHALHQAGQPTSGCLRLFTPDGVVVLQGGTDLTADVALVAREDLTTLLFEPPTQPATQRYAQAPIRRALEDYLLSQSDWLSAEAETWRATDRARLGKRLGVEGATWQQVVENYMGGPPCSPEVLKTIRSMYTFGSRYSFGCRNRAMAGGQDPDSLTPQRYAEVLADVWLAHANAAKAGSEPVAPWWTRFRASSLDESDGLAPASAPTLSFSSPNLKLLVVDKLMYLKPLLTPVFDVYEFCAHYPDGPLDPEANWYNDWKSVPEVMEWFDRLPVRADLAEHVDELIFDGGNDVYAQVCPLWDGEDDRFDVTEITDADLDQLPNLKRIYGLAHTLGEETKARLASRQITLQ
ncbi:MAG: hypothetical protein LBR27_05695 [Bifidobacteriaceae bacterium]|nr:hypothetical protein [Bifidobacteriaceae bacterium]